MHNEKPKGNDDDDLHIIEDEKPEEEDEEDLDRAEEDDDEDEDEDVDEDNDQDIIGGEDDLGVDLHHVNKPGVVDPTTTDDEDLESQCMAFFTFYYLIMLLTWDGEGHKGGQQRSRSYGDEAMRVINGRLFDSRKGTKECD